MQTTSSQLMTDDVSMFRPPSGKARRPVRGVPMGNIPSRNARKLPVKPKHEVVEQSHVIGHLADFEESWFGEMT